jgi:hypothetical protein
MVFQLTVILHIGPLPRSLQTFPHLWKTRKNQNSSTRRAGSGRACECGAVSYTFLSASPSLRGPHHVSEHASVVLLAIRRFLSASPSLTNEGRGPHHVSRRAVALTSHGPRRDTFCLQNLHFNSKLTL